MLPKEEIIESNPHLSNDHHLGVSVSLLASFGMTSMGLLLTPAMHALAEQYPEIPYGIVSMLATIPNLMSMAVAFLMATTLAEKVNHRILLLTGLACFTVGGTVPFFIHQFELVIASRVLFGFGYGVILNQTNAVIVKLYHGRKLNRLLSLCSIMTNAICMISIVAGGIISDYNVNIIWLVHTVGLIPFTLVLIFLPEPKREYAVNKKYSRVTKHRIRKKHDHEQRIPASVFLIAVCFGLAYMISKTVMLTMSSIMIEESIGTAAIAGMLLAMNRAGGLLGGSVFSIVYKKFGVFTMTAAMALETAMVVICWRSSNVFLLGGAIAMLGAAQFIMQPTIMASLARNLPDISDRAISLVMAVLNLGGFLPSIYLSFLEAATGKEDFRFAIFILLILSAMVTVVWIIRGCFLEKRKSHKLFLGQQHSLKAGGADSAKAGGAEIEKQ